MDTSKQRSGPGAGVREQADAEAVAVAARVKRQLLMGAALLLALASIYAGMLESGRLIQVVLAALAAACVFVGFRTGRAGAAPAGAPPADTPVQEHPASSRGSRPPS
jgi:hypothetical protein